MVSQSLLTIFITHPLWLDFDDFWIYFHFSCFNFIFHLVHVTYKILHLSIFHTISVSNMLMPTNFFPQCSDPRLTSTEFQFHAKQHITFC